MRIWSCHPKYLDRQGLLGLWVETLLCQKVLAGGTKGYKNHPQLNRWRAVAQPLVAIGFYLSVVCQEGLRRGYNFNASLILHPPPPPPSSSVPTLAAATATTTTTMAAMPLLEVTNGQIAYELTHLREKLQKRGDQERWALCRDLQDHEVLPHPCFSIVSGGIAEWEKLKTEVVEGKGKGKKKKGGKQANNNATTTTVTTVSSRSHKSKKRGRQGIVIEEEEEEMVATTMMSVNDETRRKTRSMAAAAAGSSALEEEEEGKKKKQNKKRMTKKVEEEGE